MLKVNVGLSRKLSKDFNSTGFTLNLEGEVAAALDDPEAVIERIKEFYDLAEEAIDLQIERSQGDEAIASRDTGPEMSAPQHRNRIGRQPEKPRSSSYSKGHTSRPLNGNGRNDAEPATNKQVQFLLSIGKRRRLSTAQLERKVIEIVGHEVGLYDLTKKEAGVVIDALNEGSTNERLVQH